MHYTTFKGHIAQPQIQSTTISPPPFTISPVTSSSPATFLFLSFHTLNSPSLLPISSSPKKILLWTTLKPHMWTETCFWVSILYRSSKYSLHILHTLLSPISILYSAETFHFSSIHLTHLLLKQFPFHIYILIHLPSKLFIHLLFVLINTPYNLIPTSQYFLQPSPHHSTIHFLDSFPLPSLSHMPLLHFQPLLISPAPTFVQHFYLHSNLLSCFQDT